MDARPEASTYRLSAADVITEVNDVWRQFATDNGDPELVDRSLGTSLWQHISDFETREIYSMLFKRARDTGQTFAVPFWCDAPAVRRKMTLAIVPLDGMILELRASTEFVEPRTREILLDASVPRAGDLLTICGWCKLVRLDGEWVPVEEVIPRLDLEVSSVPPLTHGMCEPCMNRVLAAAGVH